MDLIDYLLIFVIAVIAGLAIWYVIRSKKRGSKCIGCPEGGHCAGCSHGCGKTVK